MSSKTLVFPYFCSAILDLSSWLLGLHRWLLWVSAKHEVITTFRGRKSLSLSLCLSLQTRKHFSESSIRLPVLGNQPSATKLWLKQSPAREDHHDWISEAQFTRIESSLLGKSMVLGLRTILFSVIPTPACCFRWLYCHCSLSSLSQKFESSIS